MCALSSNGVPLPQVSAFAGGGVCAVFVSAMSRHPRMTGALGTLPEDTALLDEYRQRHYDKYPPTASHSAILARVTNQGTEHAHICDSISCT
jgi:hypothetical protein